MQHAFVVCMLTSLCLQLDDECSFADIHEDVKESKADVMNIKIIAAVVLFIEVIVGGMVPIIVGSFEKLHIWHSLLNTFSGGIFLGAGELLFVYFTQSLHSLHLFFIDLLLN